MYENQTFNTIMQRMLNNVSDDIDKREGSIIYTALAPLALELETYYEALDEVLTETFADTASYYYLTKRAAERNIYPIEATPSTLRMMADPPTAEIEVGDRFTSEDYELTFEVISGDDITIFFVNSGNDNSTFISFIAIVIKDFITLIIIKNCSYCLSYRGDYRQSRKRNAYTC